MWQSISTVVDRGVAALPNRIQEPIDQLLTAGALYNKYLREEGWVESVKRGAPVTRDGTPIPWYTYAAIDVLDDRLSDDLRVFEYGSGFSTVWLAERAAEVYGVEDDAEWVERVTPHLPENGQILHRNDRDEYVNAPDGLGEFDIVIIDGVHRGACVEQALACRADGGCIVVDDLLNIERKNPRGLTLDDYNPLFDSELKQLPLTGLKPSVTEKRRTDIFYPEDNCLGL